MKIIYKKGSLLDCEEKFIVHGCNARGVMGAGIAKLIKKKYPRTYKVYTDWHRDTGLELGRVIWADCGDKIIGNAIIQDHYGRSEKQYCSYEAIRTCMISINHQFSLPIPPFNRSNKVVAMPRIGAGLAGGDWGIIEQIIDEELQDVQPVVYYL
jgi:O-acetyl-ADP-ribose deacetylase (regulator of RNase III)